MNLERRQVRAVQDAQDPARRLRTAAGADRKRTPGRTSGPNGARGTPRKPITPSPSRRQISRNGIKLPEVKDSATATHPLYPRIAMFRVLCSELLDRYGIAIYVDQIRS